MMRTILGVWLVMVAGLVTALGSSPAQACACCDGHTQRRPVGWSNTGKTLLVRTTKWEACEDTARLELWRVGGSKPAGCYDLFNAPNRKVACSAVKPYHGSEAVAPEPEPAKVERKFTPAAPIDGRWIRSWRTLDVPDPSDPDADLPFDTYTVGVELWTGSGWQEVWRGHAGEHRYPGGEDDPPLSAPLRVELWPTPAGDRAALVLDNDYADPGIGHFYDRLHWVRIPEGTRGLRGLIAVSPAWQGEPIPTLKRGGVAQRRQGMWQNSRGMRKYRAVELDAAAEHFIEALRFDPGNVMARYNLSCIMARRGLVERALSQLGALAREAAGGACPQCEARIERAAVDEDFAALRSDPRFRAIVGGAAP